jgi:hypothetical protein
MSTTDGSTKEWRDLLAPLQRGLLGMVRRMAVKLSSGVAWQVAGHLLMNSSSREAVLSEVFSGVGFYGRPKAGHRAEAIVLFAGGEAANPVIVATRDEDSRAAVAGKVDEDETAVFNSQAILHVTKAGKVMAYLAGHIADAVGLAKASELNNLRAFVLQQFPAAGVGHVHATPSGPTTSTTAVVVPVGSPSSAYPGTDVLKGQ